MLAMQLTKPGPIAQRPLQLVDAPLPVPGPADLLVRVSVCGVCHTDLHEAEGDLPLPRLPVIPGHQAVGPVVDRGPQVHDVRVGERVGIAWLQETCGTCAYCHSERENLCPSARFTGWSVDGVYAQYVCVPAAFAYRIPASFPDLQAAPLLCGGIIGYRALRLSGIQGGQRLGLYGFGASAHVAIQVARHWGCEVYVFTRSAGNQVLARKLGAAWAGTSRDDPGAKMHASIMFAPAGQLVPEALALLAPGGTLALAGIHMSEIPPLDYARHLYRENVLRSVANATRRDGEGLLALAAGVPIRTEVTAFALEQANEALLAVKTSALSGAAVLTVA